MSEVFDLLKSIFSPKGNKDTSVIVKNYINGNNNSSNNFSNNHNNQQKSKKTQKTSNSKSISNSSIRLKSIRLYSTGSKGKVFTNKFYKSINHNFGIEVVLKNNTSKPQTVNLGHCIYDKNGKNIIKGNFYPKISPHSQFIQNIYVKPQDFSKMKTGSYKSQFWINDNRVQKVFFTIGIK